MERVPTTSFERFAERFVRAYWETVKSNAFSAPPNEPVEETVEELLAEVSHEVEFQGASDLEGAAYLLRITSRYGDWWRFRFRQRHPNWELFEASARSDSKIPHNLLGPPYSQHFVPFLNHVAEIANQKTSDLQ